MSSVCECLRLLPLVSNALRLLPVDRRGTRYKAQTSALTQVNA